MGTNSTKFVIDVASDGTAHFRPISRLERFLEPGAILIAGLVAILLVISF